MHTQSAQLRPYRFTRADYHAMAHARILPAAARVELLEGEIAQMSPIGPRHNGIVNRLNAWFSARLGERAICQVQGPIAIGDDSEPEPDIALLRPRADYYQSSHPTPSDVLLLIEVAESSLPIDLDLKRGLYARAGIPEYWVVDVGAGVVVVHRAPSGSKYRDVATLTAGRELAPGGISGLVLRVDTVLGQI